MFTKITIAATLAAATTAGIVYLASSSTPAIAHTEHTYIVGTEAGYAPYEFLDKDGKIVGFDIDLINYICSNIHAECKVKNIAFDSLIPSVKFKKIDMAIAALGATDKRKKIVDFSDEYLPGSSMSFVVLKNSAYKNPAELKNLGYQKGTLLGTYLKQKTDYNLTGYDSYDLALLDLKSGRIQALVADTPVIKDFLKKDTMLKTLGEPVRDPIFSKGFAIALSKSNPKLTEAVNKAIAQAKADGTIQKLQEKYGITDE